MPVLRSKEATFERVKAGLERQIIHLEKLMTVVLNFSDGPWSNPEPFHSHPHEQISYVVEGEIIFFCEGEAEQQLKSGDLFYIPSGKEHGIRLLTENATLVDNFSPIREDFLGCPSDENRKR
jgi:mannose-6-phosphate isomerase-like protein (cupin superfamily)